MSDLREIYQEVILDHNKWPRNFGALKNQNRRAEGYNPLCGDQISVELLLEDGVVKEIGFQGQGCAICTASASLMTQSLKGRTEEEAEALFNAFHNMVMGSEEESGANGLDLGKLKAFAGVKEFPVRVKCATLPWHTVHAALLDDQSQSVSTE